MDKAKEADVQKAAKAKPYLGCIAQFPRAIEYVARITQFGAEKRGIPLSESKWFNEPVVNIREAQSRHELKQAEGELNDPESGFLHLGHEAWNVLARLELKLRASALAGPDSTDSDLPARIHVDQVKALRARTGGGLAECLDALKRAAGDEDMAAEYLRTRRGR